MKCKQIIILFVACIAVVIIGCQQIGKSLEQMGYSKEGKIIQAAGAAGAAVAPFSVDEEVEIGRAMAARLIEGSGGIYPNENLNRYVNLVGRAVALNVRRDDLDSSLYQFGVLNTNEINAFATPGGYILVTMGALKMIQNEAELAGVLAHEISHVDKGHMLTAIKTAHGVEFLSKMVSLYDSNNNSGLNQLLSDSSESGLAILYKKGLSRECEQEADENAVRLLVKAGYYPGALNDFLRRINDTSNQNASVLKTLTATHPAPSTRIKTIDKYSDENGFDKITGQKAEKRYQTELSQL
jgi:predicted Zn-dependent protease